jgi:two-component system response regulator YesN
VDTFVREVEKRGVALYEQHYYLNRFLLAILTVPADAGIPVHDLFGEEDDPFRQASQLFDYAAIRSFYKKKVVQPVIGRMNQFRKSGSEMILEKVMALIDQKNGDVTLAECAQELGYHPSYIWRVLKNTRDITFTDYIAEQKLRIATRSVSEIAERLSYSNAQNFIRLFKKHMGITPGQYRKHSREKAQ